jgi:monovalent cation:H+ antiporter, CPA1 family
MPGGEFFILEEKIILLLFIASLVGIAARRLRMPYTVGLVVVGLGLAIAGQVDLEITSDIILGLLIPPLVFEAAYHLNFDDLQRNLKPILILAIPGVLVTTLLVGSVISLGAGLPIQMALLIGALVAATDPDAVVALIRSLGVPKRLQVLLEGESLLNDGTVIVVFNLMLSIVLTGKFNLITSLTQFFTVAGGGLVIGFILGWLFSQMISRINDHLLETTLTSVLAFGAYLIAESLGTSGVMAVVAAGLVNGNIGAKGMSPTTRIVVFNFWEYAAFLATTFIFLLIGLQIDINTLIENWLPILWVIGAVLISRVVVVYSLSIINRDIPLRWQHVLFWGGLRGALAPALAISLPTELGPVRTQIQAMVFGVVLFNLLIQGTTLGPFVRRLKLVQRSHTQDEYERRHARAVAIRSAYDHIEERFREGLISDKSWQTLSNVLKRRHLALTDAVSEIMLRDPEVEAEELDTAWREALRSQRSTYSNLLTDGFITEDTFERLVGEVDLALMESHMNWSDYIQSQRRAPIKSLITAVVPHFDEENIINALNKLGFSVTRLPSEERLLLHGSTTLLIGTPEGSENAVIRTLEENCSPSTTKSLPMAIMGIQQQTGTDIFTFDVERFIEL